MAGLVFSTDMVTSTSAGPKQRDVDYLDRATGMWLDAQYLACIIDATRERIQTLQRRIRRGEEWFTVHGKDHPRWKHNRKLIALLDAQLDLARFSLEWLRHACWDNTCQTYCAYQHCTAAERAKWHTEHHPADVSSPQALWAWLNTGCDPLDWPRRGEGAFGWYADGRVYHGFDWR